MLRVSEAELQANVVDAAKKLGWRVYHALPAQTGRGWRTATMGDLGWPDLALARRGSAIYAELKGHDGRGVLGAPTKPQLEWLAMLSGEPVEWWAQGLDRQVTVQAEEGRLIVVALWGPLSWASGAIERVLTEGRGDLT